MRLHYEICDTLTFDVFQIERCQHSADIHHDKMLVNRNCARNFSFLLVKHSDLDREYTVYNATNLLNTGRVYEMFFKYLWYRSSDRICYSMRSMRLFWEDENENCSSSKYTAETIHQNEKGKQKSKSRKSKTFGAYFWVFRRRKRRRRSNYRNLCIHKTVENVLNLLRILKLLRSCVFFSGLWKCFIAGIGYRWCYHIWEYGRLHNPNCQSIQRISIAKSWILHRT